MLTNLINNKILLVYTMLSYIVCRKLLVYEIDLATIKFSEMVIRSVLFLVAYFITTIVIALTVKLIINIINNIKHHI